MHIDSETVYIELAPGSTSINFTTQELSTVHVARVHWKGGRKWESRSVVSDVSLADALRNIADGFDRFGGLHELIDAFTRPREADAL